jgi:hypothetical protein
MIQIIGIDLSQSKDMSAISSVCSHCRHIIEIKTYDPNTYGCELTIFKNCPKCGVRFTKHIINE